MSGNLKFRAISNAHALYPNNIIPQNFKISHQKDSSGADDNNESGEFWEKKERTAACRGKTQ